MPNARVVTQRAGSPGSARGGRPPKRPESSLPLALYSASKSAATMLTVRYAKSQPGIKFNAVEPGPTATDMTAAFGIGRPPQDSAAVVVRPATPGADGPTGVLRDENGELPW
nr:SDR family NAD(P)-dependent oxidoreductase [Streptomyces sp. NBC_01725]